MKAFVAIQKAFLHVRELYVALSVYSDDLQTKTFSLELDLFFSKRFLFLSFVDERNRYLCIVWYNSLMRLNVINKNAKLSLKRLITCLKKSQVIRVLQHLNTFRIYVRTSIIVYALFLSVFYDTCSVAN